MSEPTAIAGILGFARNVLAHAARTLLSVLLILVAFRAAPDTAQSSGAKEFTSEQLEEIVAPVALYSDDILRYLLAASTFPEQIKVAAPLAEQGVEQLSDDDPRLKDLDASVVALLPFPDVLSMMSEHEDWTRDLGDAMAAQSADVLKAVQSFRSKTRAAGNLATTAEQKVIVEADVIRIEAADPKVVYVPVYDPQVVVVEKNSLSPLITFGAGVLVGSLVNRGYPWGWWGGFHWHTGHVVGWGGRWWRPPPLYRPRPPRPPYYRPRPPQYRPPRPGNRPRPPMVRPPSAGRPPSVGRPPSGGRPPSAGRPPARVRPARPTIERARPAPRSGGAFGGTTRGSRARGDSLRGAGSRARSSGGGRKR